MTKQEELSWAYTLGRRDEKAEVLARYNKRIKLKEIAEEYKKITRDEHFSYKWHTSK